MTTEIILTQSHVLPDRCRIHFMTAPRSPHEPMSAKEPMVKTRVWLSEWKTYFHNFCSRNDKKVSYRVLIRLRLRDDEACIE